MSCNPAVASPYGRDADLGLMLRCVTQLAPLFQTGATSPDLAVRMAGSAIEAYRPESPADFVNAARAIAFSMASIGLVTQAAAPGMALSEQMRVYGRANVLSRSADQSERAMMQRRRYHRANPSQAQPAASPEPSEAVRNLEESAYEPDEAEIMAAVEEAVAAHRAAVEAAAAEDQAQKPTPDAPPADPVQPAVPAAATAVPATTPAPAAATPAPLAAAPLAAAAIPSGSSQVNGMAILPPSSPMQDESLQFSALRRVAEHTRPHPA